MAHIKNETYTGTRDAWEVIWEAVQEAIASTEHRSPEIAEQYKNAYISIRGGSDL